MRRMTTADVTFVVELLHTWRHSALTWEGVQSKISSDLLEGRPAWSRQSLHANKAIKQAWDAANARLSALSAKSRISCSTDPTKAEALQSELDELQAKYEALLIRHRQVIYNASFLPGGTSLLFDPLPDNTPLPQGRRRRKKARPT
jgi:hypothetical protein